MNKIQLQRKPVDVAQLLKQRAQEGHTSQLFSEPALFYEGQELKIVYGTFDKPNPDLLWACRTLQFQRNTRTNGLETQSRIFGFRPRIALRNDYCSATSLASEQPKQHQIICDFGKRMAEVYADHAPDRWARHQGLVPNVKPSWYIPGTPFTSGIVNKNNPLNYHFDTGNFEQVFSCMVVFADGIEGGNLSIPAYDIRLKLQNNSYLLFDGQELLHGVTPITRTKMGAYRYSIVYYSLKAMCHCLTREEEVARIAKLKTKKFKEGSQK